MTAGWVAAATRGRALLGRLVGTSGARALAESESWADTTTQLRTTVYGTDLPTDADRATARRNAATATAWQLRVLAGWLPPAASGLARLFAGPLEIANIEQRLGQLAGDDPVASIPLGSLAVAGARIGGANSAEQIRDMLARSAWGDPGGSDPLAIGLGLRVAWARRIVRQVPDAGDWARGATAVLIARERFAFDRTIGDRTSHEVDALLGTRWERATTLSDLVDQLPKSAAWPLGPSPSPENLWEAELAVVRRVGTDAMKMATTGRYTRNTVMAIMALLLVDLWLVTAAIEVAGRSPQGVFDVVA